MLKKIQRATASSPEGTRGLVRGVLACAAQNIRAHAHLTADICHQ